jgi:transcriptional regulator with XRE-family HTH domain
VGERAANQLSRRVRLAIGADLAGLRSDAGLTAAALGRGAGVDPSYVRRIEKGAAEPSITTYARLSVALGADLSLRLYPQSGPSIHDRHQAPIVEALLGAVHSRWRPYPEIAVRRPARGWIDVGLHDPRAAVFVAAEIQSELRRVEQLIRWSEEKVQALPSWEGWAHLGAMTSVSKLLVVRETPCHSDRRPGAPANDRRRLSGRPARRARRTDRELGLARFRGALGRSSPARDRDRRETLIREILIVARP